MGLLIATVTGKDEHGAENTVKKFRTRRLVPGTNRVAYHRQQSVVSSSPMAECKALAAFC
jgi:hypothetical protein